MNETLRLFDQFARTDTIPAQYTEPIFDALNRLAWKNVERIRELLEDWLSTYPPETKKDLVGRFRSKRDNDHQGVFFELFLLQFLTRLGYAVTVNPQMPSGVTPDFLATSLSGEKFYLEATVVETKSFQDSPSEKVALDALNELNCPDFWLGVEMQGVLQRTLPLTKRQEIQAWIDGLDYESVQDVWARNRQPPSFVVSHAGWTLTVEAIPRSPEKRGKVGGRPLGFGPGRGGFVDAAKPIQKAIHAKAHHYPDIGAPFIVAINSLCLAGVDRIDVLLALFGWEASTGDPDIARILPPTGIRRGDWVWDTEKNNRVSAVLLFNELQPHTMASAPVCLYENPWAPHPIPASLRRVPH